MKYENIENEQTAPLQWLQKILDDANTVYSLCAPLNGCKMTSGENLCSSHVQKCSGSSRCCRDCMLQGLYNVINSSLIQKTDTIIQNSSSNISITFEDSHEQVIYVNILVSFKVLAAQLIMMWALGGKIRTMEKVIACTNNFEEYSINDNISINTTLRAFMFILLVCDLLGCVIVIIYTTTYIIFNFNMLLKCQTIFALHLSWLGIYTLHLLNHLVIILPNLKVLQYKVLLMRRYRRRHIKANYPTSFSFPRENFNSILLIIYTVSLIWWIFLPIYFLKCHA